nr:protein disulfide isomerase pTAC5, chloroplastic-like [Ipomoea batatas]
MGISLPVTFSFNTIIHRKPQSLSESTTRAPFLFKPSLEILSKSHICFALPPSNSGDSSGFEQREEARWLREEQRWLREEQRWLREERRWNAEREALLREIQALQLQIQELKSRSPLQEVSVSETVANIVKLLQVLKEGDLVNNVNRIAESGSIAVPLVMEATKEEEEVVIKEIVKEVEREAGEVKKRKTLRKGSEGDDVRFMQEALLKLGFYCGEEDMEYSSFSSGTERAVKTWQASFGAIEDGIMSSELLERLYMEQTFEKSDLRLNENPEQHDVNSPEARANGAPVASIMEISEFEQKVVKEGDTETDITQHRVFLLGENRWEEPSRLKGNMQPAATKSSSGKATTKCLSCRGEGRLLCMECDGSGEPNIEPQFLEWIDEDTKCPYCEGIGFVTCDVCEGKKVVET